MFVTPKPIHPMIMKLIEEEKKEIQQKKDGRIEKIRESKLKRSPEMSPLRLPSPDVLDGVNPQ